ncbi:hypothetical protein Nepgr_006858 [Nepenthes gracilis]|uniref:WRKY domain-containing protein n=1 Tax=Nepenthes gracilis TaxID=150966 RepID=A0AAD3S5W9_NEPGR|nr:hypothetical protein Nepgr_006858 [Nepenthes gracilis]
MEEVTALVSYCCKLAKDLDSNLEGLSNHHDVLLQQIEHIIYMFTSARDHLRSRNQHMRIDSSLQLPDQEIPEPLPGQIEIGGHGAVAAMLGMEVPSTAIIPGNAGTHKQHTGGAEASIRWWSNRREAQPGGSTSASPRTRRRTDGEKRTVRVAAPQIGNTEIPPEDDYSWRKYGQKEILRARFPRQWRGYLRLISSRVVDVVHKESRRGWKRVEGMGEEIGTVLYRREKDLPAVAFGWFWGRGGAIASVRG